MAEFLKMQLDYVFFFYGLSFFILSAICFAFVKDKKAAFPCLFLALFGVVHGLNEWLDLFAYSFFDNNIFSEIRAIVMAVSFIFLFEFARRARKVLKGKTFGLWIYVPFLIAAFSGILYGFDSFKATVRYSLGFTSAILAALVIYEAAMRQPDKFRRPLLTLSTAMAFYGLCAGLVPAKAAVIPACWINQDSFFNLTGFPIQLARAVCAYVSAIAIWFYFQAMQASGQISKKYSLNIRFRTHAMAIALFVIIAAGWFFTNLAGNYAKSRLVNDTNRSAIILSHRLNDKLLKTNQVALTMSGSPWIAPALISRDTGDIENANSVLDRYNKSLDMSVCYLMDSEGVVIASSNRGDSNSFVGKSYGFRPYFKEAITGKQGGYFGVGVTSNERGYYASAPVKDNQGNIVGAVVAKRNLDRIEKDFKEYPYAFLADPNGIIFLSSRPELLFNSLWPINEKTQFDLLSSRQFGARFFKALMQKELTDNSYVTYNKNNFYVLRRPIDAGGWTIIFLHYTSQIFHYRFFSIAFVMFVCSLIITFFIIIKQEERDRESALKLLTMLEEVRFVFEHTRDFIYRHDTNGVFTYVSPSIENITGYPVEEWSKHYTSYLTDNPINKKAIEYTENALKTGEESPIYQLEVFHKDGRRVTLEINERPFFEDKKIVGIVGVARDITERKKAEESLRDSEERFRDMVSNIPGVIYRCANDPDWTMEFISDEISEISGYPASDFIHNKVRTYASIIYPEDTGTMDKVVQKSVAEKKPYVLEYRIIHADGTIKWVYEKGQGVFNDRGNLLWLDGAIFDISERKKIDKLKDEFVNTVSHELRTPLTAIKEGIAIVLDGSAGGVNEEQKDFLTTAKRNVDRLARLINDVLDFQKLQAGRMDFNFIAIDINSVVKEVNATMDVLVKNKGLELRLDLAEGLPQVFMDRDKIIQVLTNLISNAIKFTDKGSIVIETSLKYDNAVGVSVSDTGFGIRNEDISKLFHSFTQLAKERYRGTGSSGLGLAISKEIIQYHGGKIWAESEYGKGSKFSFILPVKERRAR